MCGRRSKCTRRSCCGCNTTSRSDAHTCRMLVNSVACLTVIAATDRETVACATAVCHYTFSYSLLLVFNMLFTQQVLQHVRLCLLSPKFLVGTVGADILIKADDSCRDLVDEAKNYLLLPQERPLMQGPRTRPRKPIRCGEVLFAGKCR